MTQVKLPNKVAAALTVHLRSHRWLGEDYVLFNLAQPTQPNDTETQRILREYAEGGFTDLFNAMKCGYVSADQAAVEQVSELLRDKVVEGADQLAEIIVEIVREALESE